MSTFDATASCVLERFAEHLPHKPYCTDDLTAGLQIRSLKTALQRAYIQHNHPGMIWAMVYDVDRACVNPTDWWPIWESVGLPPPNIAVMNHRTKRGHLIYLLEAGVCRTELAHLKPLRYIASIERAYTAVLGADPGYAGLICKNPFNDRWQVWEVHGNPYTLADLAAYVDLTAKAARLPSDASESFGLGRTAPCSTVAVSGLTVPSGSIGHPTGLADGQKPSWSDCRPLTASFRSPYPLPK